MRNENDIDDGVKACPDCDRPNQFGELCDSCLGDREDEAMRAWFDDDGEDSPAGIWQ